MPVPTLIPTWSTNTGILDASVVPRPHPARITLPSPCAILKVIRAGVGFGSGTKTKWIPPEHTAPALNIVVVVGGSSECTLEPMCM